MHNSETLFTLELFREFCISLNSPSTYRLVYSLAGRSVGMQALDLGLTASAWPRCSLVLPTYTAEKGEVNNKRTKSALGGSLIPRNSEKSLGGNVTIKYDDTRTESIIRGAGQLQPIDPVQAAVL